ncbi:MAG: helix-turn-helix transcriptional regulator [Elusimicrobiota bacterium]
MPDIMKIIGENLRKYRKIRGFTQEKLAGHSDLHTTFIAHIETGRKVCSVKTLVKLANALKVSPETLIIAPLTLQQKPSYIKPMDKKTQTILAMFRDMPDTQKDIVISVARSVARPKYPKD